MISFTRSTRSGSRTAHVVCITLHITMQRLCVTAHLQWHRRGLVAPAIGQQRCSSKMKCKRYIKQMHRRVHRRESNIAAATERQKSHAKHARRTRLPSSSMRREEPSTDAPLPGLPSRVTRSKWMPSLLSATPKVASQHSPVVADHHRITFPLFSLHTALGLHQVPDSELREHTNE